MTAPRFILKTVAADGASYGGFIWPLEVGATVTAPDWNDLPDCGGGLHGLADGIGNGNLLSWDSNAVWIVAEIAGPVVDLGDKVKVETCTIAHVGDRQTAPQFLVDQGCDGAIVARTATAGDEGTATAGDEGTATAGDRGTATAGYRGTATAGYRGTATAGDEGTATAGDRGTATAGHEGTATAGDEGVLVIQHYDSARGAFLPAVAVVGENDIQPNVAYRLDDTGVFVPAEEVAS